MNVGSLGLHARMEAPHAIQDGGNGSSHPRGMAGVRLASGDTSDVVFARWLTLDQRAAAVEIRRRATLAQLQKQIHERG